MATRYDHRLILGPHCPMSLPLQRLLANNRDALEEVRTEAPKVKLHRQIMAKTLALPTETLAKPQVKQAYVDAVRTQATTRCLIYNYHAFFGSRKNALKAGSLYPSLENKIPPLRQLTDGHQVTVFLCLQHMTQFIELELSHSPHLQHVTETYPKGLDFSWVHFVHRMKTIWPEALVVIIDADKLAQNWAAAAALVTGHPKAHRFQRITRFPLSQLAEDGRGPCRKALKASPPASIPEWTEVMSNFFDTYGPHVPIIRRIIASPWTEDQVAHSKARFTADLDALKAVENVALIDDVVWETE